MSTSIRPSAALGPVFLSAFAGLAAVMPGAALAGGVGCDVNQYGMPDFDQRRQGLANDGNNHCVPTSNANIYGYFATHGYPPVFPGVDKTYGQEDYQAITNNISLLGSFMGTSGTGGTGGTSGYNGLVTWNILFGQNHFSAARMWNSAVNPFNVFLYRQLYGGYVSLCYGRYSFVGGGTGWDRTGGHCITLHQLENWCTTQPTFHYRDPAADEGNVAGRLTMQSPRATTSYTLTKETFTGEGTTRTQWRMNTGNPDGVKRSLDGMYVLIPLVNISASGPDLVFSPSFQLSGQTPPANIPVGGTISSLEVLADLASVLVVTQPAAGGPASLKQVNLADGTSRTISSVSSSKMATGRRGQAYYFNAGNLIATDTTPQPPIPPVLINSIPLGFVPEAIGYDDRTDEVVVVQPAGAAGPRVLRYSKTLTPIAGAFFPGVPGTGALKIEPGPQPGQWYMARAGDGSVRLFLPPVSPTAPYTEGAAVNLPGTDVLQDFHFLPSGDLIYLTRGGLPVVTQTKAARKDPNGRWITDTGNPFHLRSSGGVLTFTKSRSSYDPVLDGPDDNIGPNPEDVVSVPDCVADVASANQFPEPDGNLTADDIIVFLNWFFRGDERADVAGPNQATNPDGSFSADDIIVFLNRYFAGC